MDDGKLMTMNGYLVRGEGMVDGRSYGFEGILVGISCANLFDPSGNVARKYAVITDDGMSFAIVRGMKIEVIGGDGSGGLPEQG